MRNGVPDSTAVKVKEPTSVFILLTTPEVNCIIFLKGLKKIDQVCIGFVGLLPVLEEETLQKYYKCV